MIELVCPVCGATAQAAGPDEWPQFPFCSRRCKQIDLGRWLGEQYRIPAEGADEVPAERPGDENEAP